MCSPYIEYSIPGYNFSFVKNLSRDEIKSFISTNFEDWENNSLRILNSVKKFKDELNIANQTLQTKSEDTIICHYSESTGKLNKFKSIKEYKEFKLLINSD
jgi:hypothetical protein